MRGTQQRQTRRSSLPTRTSRALGPTGTTSWTTPADPCSPSRCLESLKTNTDSYFQERKFIKFLRNKKHFKDPQVTVERVDPQHNLYSLPTAVQTDAIIATTRHGSPCWRLPWAKGLFRFRYKRLKWVASFSNPQRSCRRRRRIDFRN